MKFFNNPSPRYEPLGLQASSILKYWILGGLLMSLVAVSSGTIGYRMGSNAHWGLLTPIGAVDHTFHYNKGFAQRPGNESDIWWQKVIPKGRGFIDNPDISPNPVGLSVFHQLHCLDAIRRSYYAALDGVEPDKHMKPGHVRHCIDYLRQSLMCHADTNIEPIDPDLGGVTGWGNSRKCRDIVGLIAWTEKWRTHNQSSIL